MRQLLFVATAAALAGCASGGATVTPAGGGAPTRVISPVFETSSEVIINPDVATVRLAIPAAPARAYQALQVAYADLGIPVKMSDPAKFTAGNLRFETSRRLGNEPLSTFFQCGSALGGTPLADIYRMRINVTATVFPAADGSELQTTATATARNPEGSSRDPVVCHSTGRLETHLANLVRLRSQS